MNFFTLELSLENLVSVVFLPFNLSVLNDFQFRGIDKHCALSILCAADAGFKGALLMGHKYPNYYN